MFGKKTPEDENITPIPVFTVDSLPRRYEPIDTVCVQLNTSWSINLKDNHIKIIREVGVEGAKHGGDAVIGFMLHSQRASPILNAYGTVIRYID